MSKRWLKASRFLKTENARRKAAQRDKHAVAFKEEKAADLAVMGEVAVSYKAAVLVDPPKQSEEAARIQHLRAQAETLQKAAKAAEAELAKAEEQAAEAEPKQSETQKQSLLTSFLKPVVGTASLLLSACQASGTPGGLWPLSARRQQS